MPDLVPLPRHILTGIKYLLCNYCCDSVERAHRLARGPFLVHFSYSLFICTHRTLVVIALRPIMATSINAEALNESPIPEAVKPTGKQLIDPYNVSGEVAEDGTVKAIDYKSTC